VNGVEALEGAELVPAAPATLHGETEPSAIAVRAAEQARVLMELVREKGLARRFAGDHEHLAVEAWAFLGAANGLTAAIAWTRRIEGDVAAWEARAEVRTLDGRTVGAAEAMCSAAEANWRRRDEYAIRSMAQTRATSKALRLVVGWIAALAGFDASLSAEEASVELAEGPATTPQLQKLAIVAGELGWDDEERRARAGVASFRDLTRGRASELLEEWGELVEEPCEDPRAKNASEKGRAKNDGAGESLEELWLEAEELLGSRARVVRAVAQLRPGEAVTADAITAGDLLGAIAAHYERVGPRQQGEAEPDRTTSDAGGDAHGRW
jgi:hypothetical protein